MKGLQVKQRTIPTCKFHEILIFDKQHLIIKIIVVFYRKFELERFDYDYYNNPIESNRIIQHISWIRGGFNHAMNQEADRQKPNKEDKNEMDKETQKS